jgi:hypothetical protein
MPGVLAGHVVASQPLKFLMNQRHQFFQRRGLALAPGQKQLRNLLWQRHSHPQVPLSIAFIQNLPGLFRFFKLFPVLAVHDNSQQLPAFLEMPDGDADWHRSPYSPALGWRATVESETHCAGVQLGFGRAWDLDSGRG